MEVREDVLARISRAIQKAADDRRACGSHDGFNLTARLSRIESLLEEVLQMNARELAVLKRIDDATTAIGTENAEIATNTAAVAQELKDLAAAGTGNDDLDAALEAKATVLENQTTLLQASADALKTIASPADTSTGAASVVTAPPVGA